MIKNNLSDLNARSATNSPAAYKPEVNAGSALPSPSSLPTPADRYAPQSRVAPHLTIQTYAPALSEPHHHLSATSEKFSNLPERPAELKVAASRNTEDFINNSEKQRLISFDLIFPGDVEPMVVNVLREPFMRASKMFARGLVGDWAEAKSGSFFVGLEDIPASAWLKIVRLVAGSADVVACKPRLDEAVAMFTAIRFLAPDPSTKQGRLLNELSKVCQWKVYLLKEGKQDSAIMKKAIERGIEKYLYAIGFDNRVADFRQKRLDSLQDTANQSDVGSNEKGLVVSSATGGDSELTSDRLNSTGEITSFHRADVSLATKSRPLQFSGCGFAMASASNTWRKALPNITLDAKTPPEVWNKIFCVVHHVGNPALCGPRHDDAAAMLEALKSLELNDADSTGCMLLSLVKQCETLERLKTQVSNLRDAIANGQKPRIESTLRALGQSDRMVVAHLDSTLLKMLLASDALPMGKFGAYEVLLDWLQYHGPDAKHMASFMRAEGLHDAIGSLPSTSALREEAAAAGILPKPEDLAPNSLRCLRTVNTCEKDARVNFLDGNEVFIYGNGRVTRWSAQTGQEIARFKLSEHGYGRESEFPTHEQILDNRFFASVNRKTSAKSNPTLWNIDTGEYVTRLKETEYCEPPKTRAQAYRFIVSGSEQGSGINNLRVGVWGKSGVEANYEFLKNFEPIYNRCDSIVCHKSTLFTAGISSNSTYTIDEYDLETNSNTRSWAVDRTTGHGDFIKLFVATDYVACLSGGKEMFIYRRDSSSNEPSLRLEAEKIHTASTSGHYVAGLSTRHFTVWDLRSGGVVQTVLNPRKIDINFSWNSIAFDGKQVVVCDNSGNVDIYAANA